MISLQMFQFIQNASVNAISQDCIQIQIKCFRVTLKYKYFGYTFVNVFELISNVLFYIKFVIFGFEQISYCLNCNKCNNI